jgi:hypothetical protein
LDALQAAPVLEMLEMLDLFQYLIFFCKKKEDCRGRTLIALVILTATESVGDRFHWMIPR